jgi:hypothetical protein
MIKYPLATVKKSFLIEDDDAMTRCHLVFKKNIFGQKLEQNSFSNNVCNISALLNKYDLIRITHKKIFFTKMFGRT